MAIISANNLTNSKRYGNTHFRYSLVYVIITMVVLLFLNIYCAKTSQMLFYKSKEVSMVDKCLNTASAIGEAELLNAATAQDAASKTGTANVTRLIVTDLYGKIVYDSTQVTLTQKYAVLPEIIEALKGNDVFNWYYHEGRMYSRAATPIYSSGNLIGCVYIAESDPEQGSVIQTLQRNILSITLVLEFAVVVFSFFFATGFSRRLRSIRSSMRIIRGGDYTHKLKLGGRDELTLLGDEFNDLTERLQASEEQRRQFVSDASHELKTPLASIKLLADSILQNDMDTQTVKEFVEDIGNEADRLNRMSAKLLSLSKTESPEDNSFELVSIVPTVERVSRMLQEIAKKNNITIVHDFQADSTILMQEDDLYQIVFNLAENAIKYNTPGGMLTMRVLQADDNAILKIEDTGVGIPQDSLPHIFKRFYRVDKARSRKSGGSGLGLSIVKTMVERNYGTITVDSTAGEGSVFTVMFPIFDTEELQ